MLVPVGHGFAPKGGGWFIPAVAGGVFTLHPLLIDVPWAACFVSGLLDWRRPWRVEHLDLFALAGFFPVAMLFSADAAAPGLWLAAVCLGWLFARMLGAAFRAWRMPDSYGPFAYYAYMPFAAVFPAAPAIIATLLPAVCFDAATLAGLHRLGRRLGGRPLARAYVFAYLLYPFPALSLMAETNDALIAALCVWAIVVATERPVARGLLMAAAALTKFLPALLALQFLGVRRGRWRYALTLVVYRRGRRLSS